MAKHKKTSKHETPKATPQPRSDETPALAPEHDDCAEPQPATAPADRAEERFVEDSLIRGDAAEADEEGALPPDATHEIVEEREGELPLIKRRRFKAF